MNNFLSALFLAIFLAFIFVPSAFGQWAVDVPQEVPISATKPLYKVGVSKTDITAFVRGVGMLGYSMAFNTAESVETPLHARAFVIEDTSKNKVAIVVCELGFITLELKQNVLKYLKEKLGTEGFRDDNLMLTAQHTHCGPGGFSYYASYNMSIPGFVPEIFQRLTEQIALSIAQANAQRIPCDIYLNQGFFPDDWEVAFNRSLAAYNLNHDVTFYPPEQKHLAVNRKMTLFSFEDYTHRPIGSINWFGVHATSISNDSHAINADNKGYAADFLEKSMLKYNPDFVGAFAQGTAGDVSPKFIFNKHHKHQRGFWEGKYPDDIESAKYNGKLQFEKAKSLIEDPQKSVLPYGKIETVVRYYDFSNIQIDTQYSHTQEVKTTSPACMSMTMLGGALVDGPAAPKGVVFIGKQAARFVRWVELTKAGKKQTEWAEKIRKKYVAQGKKDIILETGERKILGTENIKKLIIPGFADETVRTFKYFHRIQALNEKPWSPQILPIQFVKIGNVVLAAFPFEITTTAGKRLKAGLTTLFQNDHIQEIILCPYSNAYSGYLTTFEEYQAQMYEGGHTVFGENSLTALQTVFADMYHQQQLPITLQKPSLQPISFSEEELNARLFYKRKSYALWEKKKYQLPKVTLSTK